MAQTTLSRFRGDTVIGVIGRILSTLCGGVIGTVVWFVDPFPSSVHQRTT